MQLRRAGGSLLAVVAALTLGPRLGLAQERLPADSIRYNLPEIIVTTSPTLVPSPSVVREVVAEDFAAQNAHTVGEALTYVPGVSLQTGTAGDAHVAIRGLRHHDVLIVFDGIPIASAFEGAVDLHEVAIDQVSRIKVVKGAHSVLYGTNAVAGVIEIIPQAGAEGGSAGVELGEEGYRWLHGSYGHSTDRVDVFAAGSHETADGYRLSDDFSAVRNQVSDTRSNSDFERRNLLANLRWRDATIGRTSFLISASDQDRGFAPQVEIEEPDFARLTDSDRITLGVSNDLAALPLSVRLYLNRFHSTETAFTDSTYSVIDEANESTDRALGATLYSRLVATPRNLLVVSLAYQDDTFENASDPEAVLDVNAHTLTVAADNEAVLMDGVTLSAGALFSRFEQGPDDESLSAVNAQAALGYEPTPRLAFHGSVARRTRFPKLRELYRERFGNLELREQVANHYEVGSSYVSGPIQSDVAVFLSRVDGLIDRADRRSPYENLPDVTFSGFEAASGGWVSERTFARVAYTHVKADEELPDGTERQLRRIPRHTLTTELRYRLPRNVLLSLNLLYVADLYDLDPDDVHTRLDSYLTLGLKTSFDLGPHLNAYVAVSNLTDENYANRFGFPLEGRNLRFGARVRS